MRLVSYLTDRVKILRSNDTVVDPLTDSELRATPIGIVGVVGITGTPTVTVSNPQTSVSVTGTIAVSGPLTDAQLRASQVSVLGPLTDTQLRASGVPVLGPLTDAQLRASQVPVSGPLTDTQLRATQVPVSGPLTDTQLRNTPVPVSGTVSVSETRPLVERMLARAPAVGYTLWLDVTSSSATFIYVAEAPVGAVATDSTFRGARVTLDANGAPLGAVPTATAFVWNNRASASWIS